MTQATMNRVLLGDVRATLSALPERLFHCCMTSPPYWNLRSYLKPDDPSKPLEIGSERTPAEFVATMVDVFRHVRRVLRDDGVLWVNLGDSYAMDTKWGGSSSNKNEYVEGYARPKERGGASMADGNQCLMPHRVAMALQADGWILRSTIIWAKKSPMPESVSGVRWLRHKIKVPRHEYEAMQRVQSGQAGDGVQFCNHAESLPRAMQEVLERDGAGVCENQSRQEMEKKLRSCASTCREAQSTGKEISHHTDRPPQQADGGSGLRENTIAEECQEEVSDLGQGTRLHCEHRCKTPRSGEVGTDNGPGVGSDQAVAGRQVLVLQEATATVDGSCNAAQQGRGTLQREHRRGVPDLQSKEGRSGSDTILIDCPGCSKCLATGGLVLRRGKWRPTTAHEYVFMFSKSDRYFCDGDAMAEDATYAGKTIGLGDKSFSRGQANGANITPSGNGLAASFFVGEKRNPRSVWSLSSEPYAQAHFATFPSELARRCIVASTSSAGCCAKCGACYAPVVQSERVPTRPGENTKVPGRNSRMFQERDPDHPGEYKADRYDLEVGNRDPQRHVAVSRVTGYLPSCSCEQSEPARCRVLDPFGGSGTVGQVAHHLGHDWLLCELNADYLPLIESRIKTLPRCLVKPDAPKRAAVLPSQRELFA